VAETSTNLLAHFPTVNVTHGTSLGEGTLRSVAFDEFAKLDGDYAVASYYEKQPRIFWCSISKPGAKGSDVYSFAARAKLVHLALLSSGVWTPSPQLSVVYVGGSRLIGAADRSLLLDDSRPEEVSAEQVERAAHTLREWDRRAIASESSELAPLRALSAVASANLSPAVSVLVLMVAIEGILVDSRPSGTVVGALIDAATDLIGTQDGTASLIRRMYGFRSEFLHGRASSELQSGDLTSLAWLAVKVSLAASQSPRPL
jgi:hypothetical protein